MNTDCSIDCCVEHAILITRLEHLANFQSIMIIILGILLAVAIVGFFASPIVVSWGRFKRFETDIMDLKNKDNFLLDQISDIYVGVSERWSADALNKFKDIKPRGNMI